MESLKLALFGGAAAVVLGGVLLHDWMNRRKAQRFLRRRPQLGPADFGRAYFQESDRRAMLAADVRKVLARHVPYTLEGLGPDDAFVQDLRMDELDSMSTVAFVLDLEERFGVKIPEADAKGILTFRQLLDYLEPRVPGGRVGSRVEGAGERADEAAKVHAREGS